MSSNKKGIGLKFAVWGIVSFFAKERNAKIHAVAAAAAIASGIWFDLTRQEWLWLILAITLVFVTEMINSAIELLCDLIMPEQHAKAARLKDIAAGAVLVTVLFALAVAGIIFGSRVTGP